MWPPVVGPGDSIGREKEYMSKVLDHLKTITLSMSENRHYKSILLQ